MSIYGIGTDIINISRIEKILKKNKIKFKKKIFTKKEIFYCDSKKILHHTMQKDLLPKKLL